VESPDDAAIAYGDKDAIGCVPAKLLADFQPGSLSALGHIGIVAGVAIVPAKFFGGLETQLEGG